jgi:small conductance mechanosensitive channel
MEVLRAKARQVAATEAEVIRSESGGRTALAVEQRTERDHLIKRVRVLIELAEKKGADVEAQDDYVDSIVALPAVTGVGAALTTFKAWLLSADGGGAVGLNVLKFLGTILAFQILAAVIGSLMERGMGRFRRTSDLLRTFIVNSVRKVTVFVGFVIALSMLGINIGPFLAAIGAAGFVIGFALQGTLSNFAAGVMIMLYRPYDIGDYVSAGGVTGTVRSMTLVSTTIKTPDNQTIVVPNGSIWGDVITNVTSSPERRVDLKFGVSYTDDLARVEAALTDVLAKHPDVLREPAPVIRLHELGDSSVNFVVRPWVRSADYWKVYWELTRAVKERFDREGISIPFPQRDVHLYEVARES